MARRSNDEIVIVDGAPPSRDVGRPARERQFLDVAASLFRERGFRGTTVDEIAAASAMNKATIYYYLDSKAGILFGIYETVIDELFDLLPIDDPEAGTDQDAAGRLRGAISIIVGHILRKPDYVMVFFQERQWLDKWLQPDHYATIRGKEARFVAYLAGIIEDGVATGVFRPVDPAFAVTALLGMMATSHQLARRSSGPPVEDLAEAYADFAVAALTTFATAPAAAAGAG